jgi:hypothetical protein
MSSSSVSASAGAAPADAPDDGVPGPEVGRDRQGDLGAHRQARVKSGAEAVEQALLAGVPNRVARLVRAQPDVASDGRPDRAGLDDRGTTPAIQDSRDGPARHLTGASNHRIAEAG